MTRFRSSLNHPAVTSDHTVFELLEARLLLSVLYPDLQNVAKPSDNPALPGGMDTFSPPVDSETPTYLAPGLGETTRTARPDDVLALTGYQLSSFTGADMGKDTQFVFYGQTSAGNGTTATGSILSLEGDQAAVVLPDGQVSDSMYLLWAQNSAGASYPLAINRTEAWWTGPSIATRGQTTSVFGRNLGYYDSTHEGANQSWIYIKPTGGGAGQWVTPTAVNPYKVDFAVPAGLANGTYEVWVHNGHGGDYGWSRSANLTVQDAITWTGTVRNVKTYGAKGDGVTDDTAAINAAISASSNGDQIYFPSGAYACGNTRLITVPANRRIYGDGMASSILKTAIKVQDSSKLDNMAIAVPASGLSSPQAWGLNIWIQNVAFSEDNDWNSTGALVNCLDLSSADYVYVSGCTFTGAQVGVGQDAYIDNCTFYQRWDAEMAISSWMGIRLSITNCTVRHYDTSNPASDSGWGEGRFVCLTNNWAKTNNIYMGDNSTQQFVVRAWGDQNSGEQFLFEASTAPWQGPVMSATANTVTFDPGLTPGYNNEVIIVAGKGLGQVRDCWGWDNPTRTLTVNRPWNVIPDSTSVLQIVSQPERVVMYHNSQEGTATAVSQSAHVANTGLKLYNGASDIVYDKNTLTNMRCGVYFNTQSSPGAGTRTLWCTVANNTFTNTRWVSSSTADDEGVTGPQILGVTWRNNTVNTVDPAGSAFNEAGAVGPVNSLVMEVYDKNQLTNVPVGYNLLQGVNPRNTIFYKNSFDRGSTPLSGSTALQFGALSWALDGRGSAGDGWSGAWVSGNYYHAHVTSYYNGRRLSYSADGYSDTGNGSGPADGAAGQHATYAGGEFTNRLLTAPMTGTIWVSALVDRYEAQNAFIGFTPDSTGAHRTYVGLGGSNQAVMDYYFSQYTASVTANLETTYLLLAKITMNYDGTSDRVDYWFNPSLSGGEAGLGAPTISQTGVNAIGATFQGIGVLVDRSDGSSGDTGLIDSIRMSDDVNGFTAVTTGSGNLVADYFNNLWGPVLTEPVIEGNTFSNFETTYGGNPPKPGDVLDLPTRVLTAAAASGGSAQVALPIWNAGIDDMNWSGTSDSAWLTLAAPSGSVTANSADSVMLTCNATGLSDGTHTGTVTITANGRTQMASVVFTAGIVPTVTLSATAPNGSENGPTDGAFTVTRSGSTGGPLVVNYGIAGTATNGNDYTSLSGSVTIASGQTSAAITVAVVDDSVVENTESVVVTLTDGGYAFGSPSTGAVGIADNDVATVTITATDPSAAEAGSDVGVFRVAIPSPGDKDLTVSYTVGGTALNTGGNSDYGPSLSGSVVIPAGQTSATITITPVDDGTVEPGETVSLKLAGGTNYAVGSPSAATVTIADNDSGGLLVWLKMNDGSGTTASDSSGHGRDATLFNGVAWTTDTPNGAGHALSFDGANDVATLASGGASCISDNMTMSMWVKGPVTPAGDFPRLFGHSASGSGMEMQGNSGATNVGLTVTTSAGGGGAGISNVLNGSWNQFAFTAGGGTIKTYLNGALQGAGSYNQGTGFGNTNAWILGALSAGSCNWAGKMDNFRLYNTVLTDAEIGGIYSSELLPTVTIAASDPIASESGPDSGAFTVTRAGSTAAAMTINYIVGGTATNAADYTSLGGSVVIPAGQSSATVSVAPVDDTEAEGNETVILTLDGGTAYLIDSPSTATVTIYDNDVPSVTLSATDATAVEKGSEPGAFTVTRGGSTAGDLTVSYSISGSATNGTDYASLTGSVVIAAGQSSATVVITPVDEASIEGDETAILTLASSASYSASTPSAGTVTIIDDILMAWLKMNDGSGTAAADSSGYANNASLVNGPAWTTDTPNGTGYAVSFDGANDYATIAASPSVGFGNNMTLIMWLKGPQTPHGDFPRLFMHKGSGPGLEMQGNSDQSSVGLFISTSGALNQGVGINNVLNGAWNQIAITLASGTAKTYLNGVLQDTVSYNHGDGFGNGEPWYLGTRTPGVCNWAGKMDNFRLYDTALSDSQIAAIYASEAVANPVVTLSATDASASETQTDNGVFTVTRTGSTANALAVNYAVGGSATSGADYTSLSGSVTIASGQSSATIAVAPIDDGVVENTESVILTLAGGSYDIGSPSTGTVTITDNDTAVVTVTATDAAAAEQGRDPGTFRINLAAAAQKALLINYTVTGTAANGTDYTPSLAGSVGIPAGQTSAAITITPVDDGIIEGNETVVLTATAGTNSAPGTPSSATITIADNDVPTATIAATTPGTAEVTSPYTPGLFTVSRSGSTSGDLVVNYTAGGSATCDTDYASLSGSVLIPNGATSATITIAPRSDTLAEGDETVVLSLTAGSGYTLGGPSSGTVTIADVTAGDATLDGHVSFDDILALYPYYEDGRTDHTWFDGDFTGDGVVDFDDILAMYPYYEIE